MIDSKEWKDLSAALQETLSSEGWLYVKKRRDYVDSRFLNIPEKPDLRVERHDLAARNYPLPFDAPTRVIYAQVYPVAPKDESSDLNTVCKTIQKIITSVDLNLDRKIPVDHHTRTNPLEVVSSVGNMKVYSPGTVSFYRYIGEISVTTEKSQKFIPNTPGVEEPVVRHVAPTNVPCGDAYAVLSMAVYPNEGFLTEALKRDDLKVEYKSNYPPLTNPPTL